MELDRLVEKIKEDFKDGYVVKEYSIKSVSFDKQDRIKLYKKGIFSYEILLNDFEARLSDIENHSIFDKDIITFDYKYFDYFKNMRNDLEQERYLEYKRICSETEKRVKVRIFGDD